MKASNDMLLQPIQCLAIAANRKGVTAKLVPGGVEISKATMSHVIPWTEVFGTQNGGSWALDWMRWMDSVCPSLPEPEPEQPAEVRPGSSA